MNAGSGHGESFGSRVATLRVRTRADERDDDRQITPGVPCDLTAGDDRRCEFVGGVGVGSVTQDDVQEKYRTVRVGRLPSEPFEAERLIDHRVRSSRRQLVIAEVDHEMSLRPQLGVENPGRLERCVGGDWPKAGSRDGHRLVAKGPP